MRFKKGSKVEVFSKKDVSTGAWLCAEVISGNGHTYSVRYGWFPMTDEAVVERVPRNVIRPCPPPVQGVGTWAPGDLVEAFHDLSWKPARVVKVIGMNNFLVRILGSSKGLLVHKSHLRVRRCWQDGKWFVIGKDLEIDGVSVGKSQSNTWVKQCVENDFTPVEKVIEIPKPCVVATRTLKRRSQLGSYDHELHPEATQKKRLIEKDGSHQLIRSVHPYPTFDEVDAIVYPNEIVGDNHARNCFNIPTVDFSRIDEISRNDSFALESSISVYTDDCTSSIGSCSAMSDGAHNLPFKISTQHNSNLEDYCSDAESSSGVDYEKEGCSLSSDDQLYHRSELQTYFTTIEDLYALGPLSWEDEAKLTNLRHVLHISDDEHLTVLRNLIPANSTLLFS